MLRHVRFELVIEDLIENDVDSIRKQTMLVLWDQFPGSRIFLAVRGEELSYLNEDKIHLSREMNLTHILTQNNIVLGMIHPDLIRQYYLGEICVNNLMLLALKVPVKDQLKYLIPAKDFKPKAFRDVLSLGESDQ